ncbi:methyl-accepting chemotaxis protein [Cytobacillus spongiae]|uniref:methyl-accepting chemotaxis protein n=1 Tax=Cytobacillus spongiae TaxID=2901381 RepID=UPI001F37F9C8|nr:methyl-accepting chemotaxis protein [Cytobacillus spongiae]UII56656.1 methyl-accepting chemotaxis protein [Cytobacillus spongiae]
MIKKGNKSKSTGTNSLLVKMLSAFVPLTLIAMLSVSTISLYVAYQNIATDSKVWLKTYAEEMLKEIQREFIGHQRLAETISETVGVNGLSMTAKEYEELLKRQVQLNESTSGSGVWFEPNTYDQAIKYFGPYVYKDGDQLIYTEEYGTDEYDYPKQPWYTIGKEGIAWTDPYYDETTDITMVTTTVPIKNSADKFIGTVTADINLQTIKEKVQSIKVKESGFAFLIDNNGFFISHPDEDKIMKTKLEDDQELGELSKSFSHSNGQVQLSTSSETMNIYYLTIPETGWKLAVAVPQIELYASLYNLAVKVLAATIVVLILVISFIYFFSKKHTKEINIINSAMEKLAAGDLTSKATVKSKDELGNLAHRLNETVDTIKKMVLSIYENAHTLASTSAQLSVSSEETNKAIHEVATSIQYAAQITNDEVQQMATLMQVYEEVSELVGMIAQDVQKLQGSTDETNLLAKEGNESILSFIQNMKTIENTGDLVSTRINGLSKTSEQIEGMINLIDEIADQTNLLALNASIEAARAGEHGKGFAVVAEEVRKLANESRDASSNIKDLIHEVQSHINGVVVQMDDNMKAIKDGIIQVEESGEKFNTISTNVQTVVATSHQTSKGIQDIEQHMHKLQEIVQEVNHLIEKTNDYIQHVSAASEEQSASVDEITSSSELLSQRALDLEANVSKFKLD